jgi:thioredoxin reductase
VGVPAGPVDYLIIGAGPAGLQLAQSLGQAGHDYLVLEASSGPGAFFAQYPRHRQLISINKPHTGTDDPELNLRMDWNSLLSPDPRLLFTRYSERYFPAAGDMVRYLEDYARGFDLNIRYETRVARITRAADGFAVTDEDGRDWPARRVIIATGVSAPYIPPVPGIELAEQYATMTVDPRDYTDQRVLIIGKGNSALETADNLVETAAVIHVAGPSSLRLAWKTHYVGHLRAVNNNFLDTYQLKSQNAVLDGTVLSIERPGGEGQFTVRFSFSRANETVKELRYDRVIACTGFRFEAGLLAPDCRPPMLHKDRFAELTPAYEAAGVPGLYLAGTLMQVRDFKRSTSGFIHGFRYGVRALHHILRLRYHAVGWPSSGVAPGGEAVADAILARVNRTSALWQQFGVLGDVVLAGPDGSSRYLEEVPVDFALGGGLDDGELDGRAPDALIVTLEYGPGHDQVDPFDITVARVAQDDAGQAGDAAYLHPVVRRYAGGELVATHHVAENLENEWDKAAHRDPLIAFLGQWWPAGVPASRAGGRR